MYCGNSKRENIANNFVFLINNLYHQALEFSPVPVECPLKGLLTFQVDVGPITTIKLFLSLYQRNIALLKIKQTEGPNLFRLYRSPLYVFM